MCGIIGYIGFRKASEVIVQALKTLEYRGYDSAGIAIVNNGKIEIRKDKGKIEDIARELDFISLEGKIGIGHDRWATHGKVCKENAHPHSDCSKTIAIVHNGVLENYLSLKEDLLKKGHGFNSETDSEVIAHLFEENMKFMQIEKAFAETIKKLKGSYAIVAIMNKEEKIFTARKDSPLLLGIGEREYFFASDIPAILPYTHKVIPIKEERIAIASEDGYKITDFDGNEKPEQAVEINWSKTTAEKGGFPHFMLKEIYEQKFVLHQSLAADVGKAKEMINDAKNIHIIGCGTSYHAGLIFSILLEKYARKNAKAFIASEYQFIANPDKNTLIVAISQSGETADVLQAIKFAKTKNVKTLSLTNVMDSGIVRISDCVVYLNAGPEISVVATKTFFSQLVLIYKLIFDFDLKEILGPMERALNKEHSIKDISLKLKEKENIFFIARGLFYPIAMEAALKLKEISYIHAEAYAGGELKHGPLSLIQAGTPVIALAPNEQSFAKIYGNIKEIKARGAFVIAFTDNNELKKEVDVAIEIEKTKPDFYPFAVLPLLQFLAYHTTVLRGLDPDRPRNLAKTVTVE